MTITVLLTILILIPLTSHYPTLAGADKGCAHDGMDVDIGDWVMVGCDNCTYKQFNYRHGDSWTNKDTCDKCSCKDGTVTCKLRDCNGACTVNGLHYDKGESFKIDCETCMCLGHDEIKCNKHFCPCLIDNTIVQHGEEIVEKSDPRGTLVYRCDDGRVSIVEDNREGGPVILTRAGREDEEE